MTDPGAPPVLYFVTGSTDDGTPCSLATEHERVALERVRVWRNSSLTTYVPVADLSRAANERDRALKLAATAAVTGRAAVSAAEALMESLKKSRARIAELEAKLTMLEDANRALTSENNAAVRDLRICRLNEQLLDRVIDLVGKDPVDGIQKMEEHIAELERELAAARRSGTEDNELWELRGAELRSGRARIAELERERDEAQRELRALEWISEFGWLAGYPERGAVTRAIPESHRMSGFKSHTEAALALGREPTPAEKT